VSRPLVTVRMAATDGSAAGSRLLLQGKKDGIAYSTLTSSRKDNSNSPRRGLVIVSHGYTEHSGLYDELASELAEDGWTVVRYDLRGHGDSDGERGYITKFDDYVKDLELIHDVALHESASRSTAATDKKPLVVLFGHSLGGLVTLRYMLKLTLAPSLRHKADSVQAIVLSAPFLRVAKPLSVKDRLAVRILNALKPIHRNPFKSNYVRFLSHDETVCERMEGDSKVFAFSTIGWLVQCQKAQSFVQSQVSALSGKVPSCWFLAGKDYVVDTATAQATIKSFASSDSSTRQPSVHHYPEFFHDIFFEKQRDIPKAQLKQFLTLIESSG